MLIIVCFIVVFSRIQNVIVYIFTFEFNMINILDKLLQTIFGSQIIEKPL